MKTSLLKNLVLTAVALVLAVSTYAQGSGTIMFITGAPGVEEAGDNDLLDRMETLGYEVIQVVVESADNQSLIDDEMDNVIGIVVSSSINSKHVGAFLKETELPVMAFEQGIWDDMKLISGTGVTPGEGPLTLTIVDDNADHLILEGFDGEIDIFSATPNKFGSVAADRVPETTTALCDLENEFKTLLVYDIGDVDADGAEVPARRLCSPMHCENYENVTDDFKILFDRCVLWTMSQLEIIDGIENLNSTANIIKTATANNLMLNPIDNNANINIFDLNGRLMLQTSINKGQVASININNLPTNGIYIVQVNTGSQVYTQKFNK